VTSPEDISGTRGGNSLAHLSAGKDTNTDGTKELSFVIRKGGAACGVKLEALSRKRRGAKRQKDYGSGCVQNAKRTRGGGGYRRVPRGEMRKGSGETLKLGRVSEKGKTHGPTSESKGGKLTAGTLCFNQE